MSDNKIPRAQLPKPVLLGSWKELTAAFDALPQPSVEFELEGGVARSAWIFRGQGKPHSAKPRSGWGLAPSIERLGGGKACTWESLEILALEEFRAKARLLIPAHDLPEPEDRISWLALMQHYGIPTRLLDFTYSPYVALHFALREMPADSNEVAVWGINAIAVDEHAHRRDWDASNKERRRAAEKEVQAPGRSLRDRHPEAFDNDADALDREAREHVVRVNRALRATGARREEFNRNGCVMFSIPPLQNRRLSSQQGAFLFNVAEELTFEESLLRMTCKFKTEWCKLFHIPVNTPEPYERRLFQMNIHELSLSPDMEGLASFVRQKTRLHWAPTTRFRA